MRIVREVRWKPSFHHTSNKQYHHFHFSASYYQLQPPLPLMGKFSIQWILPIEFIFHKKCALFTVYDLLHEDVTGLLCVSSFCLRHTEPATVKPNQASIQTTAVVSRLVHEKIVDNLFPNRQFCWLVGQQKIVEGFWFCAVSRWSVDHPDSYRGPLESCVSVVGTVWAIRTTENSN